MTQGRGTYMMRVSHYDPVPAHLQQKIIEEHKKERRRELKQRVRSAADRLVGATDEVDFGWARVVRDRLAPA